MAGTDGKQKQLNTSGFWHVILPLLVLIVILFVLFVVYAMPDWALTCPPAMAGVKRLASSGATR
jgi:hypothetical protein